MLLYGAFPLNNIVNDSIRAGIRRECQVALVSKGLLSLSQRADGDINMQIKELLILQTVYM